MKKHLWTLLVWLSACPPKGLDTGPGPDADGDGFTSLEEGGLDCNDRDASIHPLAPELCDGLDQDCDGEVDEEASDAPRWFPDRDGDGHGLDQEGEEGLRSCYELEGHVAEADDCDDSDPAIHPGAAELCDAADEDCDGLLGDDDPDLEGDPWWADMDGDGFGDPERILYACEAPKDHVLPQEPHDCDDTDPEVWPGAVERCDGVDQDCDSVTDNVDFGALILCWDTDLDLHGDPKSAAPASCEALDAGWTEDCDDCDDSSASVSPSATERCGNGIDDDCDGLASGCGEAWEGEVDLSTAASRIEGMVYRDNLGRSVALADVDGDDLGELWVGADGVDTTGSSAGAASLFEGPFSGVISGDTAALVVRGAEAGDRAGWAVLLGDLLGSGTTSLVLSAPDAGLGGLVEVLDGALRGELTMGDAGLILSSREAGAGFGYALGLGELQGDHAPDLLCAAPERDESRGGVYAFAGPLSSDTSTDGSWLQVYGAQVGDYAAQSLALGDTDGDGLDDLLLGVSGDDTAGENAGAAVLFRALSASSLALADAELSLRGLHEGDSAGCAVSLGDLDGDGLAEPIVGAWGDDEAGKDAGAVAIFPSALSGDLGRDSATLLIWGLAPGDQAGFGLGILDMDGDGRDELLISAPQDATGGVGAGAVYLVDAELTGSLSLADATAVFPGEDSFDSLGTSLAGGDLDGDPFEDLAIGAHMADAEGYGAAGAVYLLSGGAGF